MHMNNCEFPMERILADFQKKVHIFGILLL